MKAITQDTYGSADGPGARGTSTSPRSATDQVLIRVRGGRRQSGRLGDHERAAVHRPPRLRAAAGRRPASVGPTYRERSRRSVASVTRFKPGDEVFGLADGSYAEYAVASEETLAPKPANLSFEKKRRPCPWPDRSRSRRCAASRPGRRC